MKVFYYNNYPSPYYVGFLNELGKLCDLTVVFERGSSSERDESWKQFSAPNIRKLTILHGIHTSEDMAFCPQIIREFKREKYDAVIIHDPASPTGILFNLYLKRKKIPFGFQVEGGFPGDGKTGMKEKLKHFLLSGARVYLSATGPKQCYFKPYGAPEERIVYYPFASFYEKDILTAPRTQEEKAALRRELGIPEEKVIVSVGAIIPRKAHDILIKAAAALPKDVGIYIIGGPANEFLRKLTEQYGKNNIHFVNFMPKEQVWKYYQMADFLAEPTRYDTWGLFVNEAMANGLPVITTRGSAAGLELIVDGENGYLVETEDVQTLAEKINHLLSHPEQQEQMARNNVQKIQPYTFENQAKVTYEALKRFFK